MNTYCVKGFDYAEDPNTGKKRRTLVTLKAGLTWDEAKKERAQRSSDDRYNRVKPQIVKERGQAAHSDGFVAGGAEGRE